MAQSAQTAFRDVFIHVFVLCVLNWASLSWMNFKCERFKTAKHQKLCCSLPSITLTPKKRAGPFQKMHIDCLCSWMTDTFDWYLKYLRFHCLLAALGNKIKPGSSELHDMSGPLRSDTQRARLRLVVMTGKWNARGSEGQRQRLLISEACLWLCGWKHVGSYG